MQEIGNNRLTACYQSYRSLPIVIGIAWNMDYTIYRLEKMKDGRIKMYGRFNKKINGYTVDASGFSREELEANLKKWAEMVGGIKWIDAFTGQAISH